MIENRDPPKPLKDFLDQLMREHFVRSVTGFPQRRVNYRRVVMQSQGRCWRSWILN